MHFAHRVSSLLFERVSTHIRIIIAFGPAETHATDIHPWSWKALSCSSGWVISTAGMGTCGATAWGVYFRYPPPSGSLWVSPFVPRAFFRNFP